MIFPQDISDLTRSPITLTTRLLSWAHLRVVNRKVVSKSIKDSPLRRYWIDAIHQGWSWQRLTWRKVHVDECALSLILFVSVIRSNGAFIINYGIMVRYIKYGRNICECALSLIIDKWQSTLANIPSVVINYGVMVSFLSLKKAIKSLIIIKRCLFSCLITMFIHV